MLAPMAQGERSPMTQEPTDGREKSTLRADWTRYSTGSSELLASPFRIRTAPSFDAGSGVTDTTRCVTGMEPAVRCTVATSPGFKDDAGTSCTAAIAPTGYTGSIEPVRKTTKVTLKIAAAAMLAMQPAPSTASSVSPQEDTLPKKRFTGTR